MDAVPVKNGSEKELRRLYDAATRYYRALKEAKSDSFDTVLTVILKQKLDEKARLKWAEFSTDHGSVPPCTELLKFLRPFHTSVEWMRIEFALDWDVFGAHFAYRKYRGVYIV